MFVTEEAHDIIVKKHKKEFQRTLLPRFLEEARRLGLDADALIALIREEEKGKEAR